MHAPRAKAEEASNASAGARRNYKKPDESLVLRSRVAGCVSAIYLLCHYLANAVRINNKTSERYRSCRDSILLGQQGTASLSHIIIYKSP